MTEECALCGLLSDDVAPQLAVTMGLLPREYQVIRERLCRSPTHSELAVFAGLWSEHCSYKSTRHLLSTLPKESPFVLAGPGSHAGVVSVGEGWAVAFKIESHNHPSAVEPYQGAATGVGGILRDVIAQGARPCALLDFLCFGDPLSRDTRRIARGVVEGIAGYGNAIGVPNLGGRTHFDAAYEGNPLVNALAAGLIRPDEQRHARATGEGNVLVLVGAATGRDGVLGAAFASEALGDSASHSVRRSHIQIGDPFSGKRLLEAVLGFGAAQGLLAAQDLGACGIACASFEMVALGGMGVDVNLSAVPLREPGLSPLEIFLSETQERFALIVRPEDLPATLRHFEQLGLCAAEIGRLNTSRRVRVFHQGRCYLDLPAELVAGGAPSSDWPLAKELPKTPAIELVLLQQDKSPQEVLLLLLAQCGDPEPIYSRYDQTVGNRTVYGPGQASAAVLRLPQSYRGFALTLTGRGDLCAADPYLGTQSALAEALRRMACVGAELLAITDGLNFASPRDPIEHLRIVEVIRGLADGLRILGVPVTGGNVSLYNQSPRGSIPPTPMIGALGVVTDVRAVPPSIIRSGQRLLLLGSLSARPVASLYARLRCGQVVGIPSVDLLAELRLTKVLQAAIAQRLIAATKPVSQGGIAATLARWCLRSQVGAQIDIPSACEWLLFGEHPAQVLLTTSHAEQDRQLEQIAAQHQVPLTRLGDIGGEHLHISGVLEIAFEKLRIAAEQRAVIR